MFAATAQRRAEAALVIVSLLWGLSFPAIKLATPFVPTVRFVALRFALATLVLLPLLPAIARAAARGAATGAPAGGASAWRGDRRAWRDGAWLGLLLTLSYATQTAGLRTTTAANSAFITCLSVVMVPPLAGLRCRQWPSRALLAALVPAVAGLALLTRPDLGRLVPGDAWTLGCALGYAVYLVELSRALTRVPYPPLLLSQLVCVTVLAGAWTLAFERGPLTWNRPVIASLLLTSLLSTVLALYLQNRFQARTTAPRAALIFATEPVFATMFAALLLRERLPGAFAGGALLILAAVAIAELAERRPALPEGGLTVRVLFLCTANSCRSQMAEAWARRLWPADWQAASAGLVTYPITDDTRQAMAEAGVDMTGQRSKPIDEFWLDDFDLVVTLSEEAARFLPTLSDPSRHRHAPVDDPMTASGAPDHVRSEFRRVRELIRALVASLGPATDGAGAAVS